MCASTPSSSEECASSGDPPSSGISLGVSAGEVGVYSSTGSPTLLMIKSSLSVPDDLPTAEGSTDTGALELSSGASALDSSSPPSGGAFGSFSPGSAAERCDSFAGIARHSTDSDSIGTFSTTRFA